MPIMTATTPSGCFIGAVLSLCLFLRAAESYYGVDISPEQQDQIVNAHNHYRSRVVPYASNMRRMYWSEELAEIAQSYASDCIVGHSVSHGSSPHGDSASSALAPFHNLLNLGENIHVLPNFDEETDLADVVEEWQRESYYYDYETRQCNPLCRCDRFLQVIWAHSCEVGCGIAFCPNPVGYAANDVYLLVCNYSPGPPADFVQRKPYRKGKPCYGCDANYPECQPSYSLTSEDHESNLCYNTEGVCIGSDPHLGIRLPEGSLLCYSFQGEQNSTFNIISNNQLEMNALFVSDSQRVNNTWIGSIGITVYHNGRKTTSLQFTASDHTILLGSRVQLSANTVSKISFSRGKLTLVETPHNHTLKYPRVGVEFLDSDLKFTVAFIKNEHINLEWHSIGEPYIHSRGVVGQFFRKGVRVDEDKQLLLIPGRPPIPVVRKNLWNFMKHKLTDETECWTSVLPSNQGVGLISGTWKDYKVDELLAVGH